MFKKKETVEQDVIPTQTLEEKRQENNVLFNQLTSKNQDYIVKLTRKLDDGGMLEEQKTEISNEMLKNILAEQPNHITARKLYGTVTDQAIYLLESKREAADAKAGEPSESWKIYLDGALLLGGTFSVITGISYFTGNQQVGLGLITLILNFLLAGLAVMVITKYAPQQGVKGGFFKYILATTVTMIAWIVLMAFGTALIPPVLNPLIPGPYTLGIGLTAFLAKWYLKKKLNIKGTLI